MALLNSPSLIGLILGFVLPAYAEDPVIVDLVKAGLTKSFYISPQALDLNVTPSFQDVADEKCLQEGFSELIAFDSRLVHGRWNHWDFKPNTRYQTLKEFWSNENGEVPETEKIVMPLAGSASALFLGSFYVSYGAYFGSSTLMGIGAACFPVALSSFAYYQSLKVLDKDHYAFQFKKLLCRGEKREIPAAVLQSALIHSIAPAKVSPSVIEGGGVESYQVRDGVLTLKALAGWKYLETECGL
jgi:hypothetical protein